MPENTLSLNRKYFDLHSCTDIPKKIDIIHHNMQHFSSRDLLEIEIKSVRRSTKLGNESRQC
jgi:hypothetical protein